MKIYIKNTISATQLTSNNIIKILTMNIALFNKIYNTKNINLLIPKYNILKHNLTIYPSDS
jgi:hypothetical protein